MDDKVYEFKHRTINERFLICPHCFETLAREDIEEFQHCPFCDFRFELNSEIEDFLLQPLVEHWVNRETAGVPGESVFRALLGGGR